MAAFQARPVAAAPRPGNQGSARLGRSFRLGTFFGFEVSIDASWIFLAILITWSLAAGLFPARYVGLGAATYWLMGIAGAAGLFLSIVLHELSHSLVARRVGLEMRGITLFLFGGVARMGGEPRTPRAELLVAIAGPIASVLVAGLAFAARAGVGAVGSVVPIEAVLWYLGYANLVLVAFNLVPAFPLDGGRVLRALLWHARGDFVRATRIAATIGSGFGTLLILLGVVLAFGGGFVAGMWWFLIGMFLRGAAGASHQEAVLQEALKGQPVRRFMDPEPRAVPSQTTLGDLVEDFFYRDQQRMYPVVADGRLAGCVTIEQVKAVPRAEWPARTVGEIATSCEPGNTISADADAAEALAAMRKEGTTRLLVTDGSRLVGALGLKDLTGFLAMKAELDARS